MLHQSSHLIGRLVVAGAVGELFELYESKGRSCALGRVTPYREYLGWLAAQDREAADGGVAECAGRAGGTDLSGSPVEPGGSARLPEQIVQEFRKP